MKLRNSLKGKIEDFKAINQDRIAIYSCGPTVYDHIHIGNLASFIYADLLRRVMTELHPESDVKHVMNITDVDDKTIKRSKEEYSGQPPAEALASLARKYEAIFYRDLDRIGFDKAATIFIRATETMGDMQALVGKLVNGGFAYAAEDGIYFSIDAYKKAGYTYGQLVPVTVSSTARSRIQNDEYSKESAHDFALWKKQKTGEPAWDFRLNDQNLAGRPGWHLECSAMSTKLLGQPFDIHTGGVDLKFPHHENEIAQSTAAAGKPLANYFFHNEHLLVDGQKMSKSLNNFYTLDDIVGKGFDPLAFRLLVLQSHYRSQMNFTWDALQAAQNRLTALYNAASLRHQPRQASSTRPDQFVSASNKIDEALRDDINTPRALEYLSSELNRVEESGITQAAIAPFTHFLEKIDRVLGLQILERTPDITNEQKQLIEARRHARGEEKFEQSDEIRDQLAAQHIGLNDMPAGPRWYRIRY